jgi:hypothetical protein
LLLFLCNSSDATRKWIVGSSYGAKGFNQCTNSSDDCTDACYIGTVGSSDGVFFLLFLHVFNLDLCFNLTYLICNYL